MLQHPRQTLSPPQLRPNRTQGYLSQRDAGLLRLVGGPMSGTPELAAVPGLSNAAAAFSDAQESSVAGGQLGRTVTFQLEQGARQTPWRAQSGQRPGAGQPADFTCGKEVHGGPHRSIQNP